MTTLSSLIENAFFRCRLQQAILSITWLLATTLVSAQGNIMITPMRIVLDENSDVEELSVINGGKDSVTYGISFLQYRMKPDGSIEEISEPDPGQLFADKYVRVYPRSITLAPNESQRVMVQISRKQQMADGEYRSHLYFKTIPKEQQEVVSTSIKSNETSFSLIPVYGLSIPLIIRKGRLSATAEISDATIVKDSTNNKVNISISRTGGNSLYGDISIDHISDVGTITKAATIKGVAVYIPLTSRSLSLSLNNIANYASGKLRIIYTGVNGIEKQKIAQKEIQLGK